MKKPHFAQPNKYLLWIAISLFVKVFFFLLRTDIAAETNQYYKSIAFDGGDATSYIEPIENFIRNGEYGIQPYDYSQTLMITKFDDFRMPGYGAPYFLLRLIFDQSTALNSLVILQLLCSGISVYVLALIALKLFKHQIFFYSTYLLYLISTYVSIFDGCLMTESFSTACIIFSIYLVLKGGNRNFLFAGLLTAWLIFMRPVYLPLLFIYVVYIIIQFVKKEGALRPALLTSLICLCAPFILADSCWIFRNFRKYERIIPLTKSLNYTGVDQSYQAALFAFINSFGGSNVHWQPGSEITFFKELSPEVKVRKYGTLPEYIYTSKFNHDSLVKIRDMVRLMTSDTVNLDKKKIIDKVLIQKLNIYSRSIQEEKPFLYYVGSRFITLKTFFVHSGTGILFRKASFELNKLELCIKIFYSLLYVTIAFTGLLSLIFLFFRGLQHAGLLLAASCGLYSSLVFPLIMKMDEFRYFAPSYPIYTLATTFALGSIYLRIKERKSRQSAS
jgi:hypothetical protein